ncbi:MAG: DUF1559 domain-containing protein, partial [Planctomycetales bacterium]|nr:DUF1559 domain-containing protein [Planctomycetales bacterium]
SLSGWSIHALLLPYLEQKVLQANIDYTRSYNVAPNVALADGTTAKLSSMRVPTFVSPGNPRDEARLEAGVATHYPVDYAVNLGTFFVWDPTTGEGGSGIAYPNSKVKAAHIQDGLSYTMFFAEVKSWQPYYRNSGRSTADLSGALGAALDPITAHNPDPTTGLTGLLTTLNGGALASGNFKTNSGHTEWVDGRAHQIGFTSSLTPNTPVLHNQGGVVYDVDWTNWQEGKDRGPGAGSVSTTPTYAVVTARSFFQGGVNVVMADGSVKWVDNTVELPIWRAYSTRAGQELIPPAKQL